MKEIDKNKNRLIDYGDTDAPCTTAIFESKIEEVEGDIETYNGLLARADTLGNKIQAGEAEVQEMGARVLLSAQGKFGRDSSEVEQLGGTRLSERAKPVPKAKAA